MKRLILALVLSALSISTQAAQFKVRLTEVMTTSPNGDLVARLDLTGDDWIYDDVAGTVSAGSRYEAQFLVAVFTIFRHNIDDFVLDASPGGGPANGSFFECVEGVFGPLNLGGVAICGAYRFGNNFIDESLPTWGPGLAFDKGLNANPIAGGDDTDAGIQQNLHGLFDGVGLESWDGTTLVVSNLVPLTSGYQFTYQVVPVPAAVWPFASALGLLGWMRRRAS